MADAPWATVWPRVAFLPSWQCGCDVLLLGQRGRTSCDTRDVVFMSFNAVASPLRTCHESVDSQNAIQTPRTKRQVTRSAKHRCRARRVARVQPDAIPAYDDDTRYAVGRRILERRSDSTHMWLSWSAPWGLWQRFRTGLELRCGCAETPTIHIPQIATLQPFHTSQKRGR